MQSRRANVFISGRVQGVFFRESARREAEHLGLKGWVRNLTDSRVEALVEGSAQAVDEFIRWCHNGPPAARVDGVAVKDAAPTGEFSSFTVER
jgi:acylphosphatase